MVSNWVFKVVLLVGLGVLGLSPASAYNVPGSQNLLIWPTTRAAVSMHVDLVRSCLPTAADVSRNNAATVNLVGQETVLNGGGGPNGYRFSVGSALLCIASPAFATHLGTAYFGGTVGGEFGNGTTHFNRGTLDQVGTVFSVFGLVSPRPGWRVFGEVGATYSKFNSTRSSNLVRGDFDALRFFANAGLIYEWQWQSPWVGRLTGMITYAAQDTSAYFETGTGAGILGPGSVPRTSLNMFFGSLEGRLGYRFNTVLPYAIASISQDFSSSEGLPLTNGPIPALFPSKTLVSGGLGIEGVGLLPGATLGLETRYISGSDHQHGWSFRGRLRGQF